ncbi:unnamed protein product [Ceratitis capitata]|uniref:(Mediterranean fruit fly) hypothetical protein n=1 Tax=Ceratitis capitata TaxID=7213 RepID=A0A811UJS3_CERCA|nr:unnamed protein product [Ceratitis capitata]
MIAIELGLNAMTASRILCSHLGYTNKSARWQRILNETQKELRVHFAHFFLNKFEYGQCSTFSKLITVDESWFYKFDPKTKQQCMVWSSTEQAHPWNRSNNSQQQK